MLTDFLQFVKFRLKTTSSIKIYGSLLKLIVIVVF